MPAVRLTSLESDRSVLSRRGVRRLPSVRGALPIVLAGASENADALIQLPRRASKLPDVFESVPVRFERCWPLNVLLLSDCVTLIGKPLSSVITAASVQPPSS